MPVTSIAVIDLWTDTNRGDEALQNALVAMLRRRHPGARLVGVFRFGTNELAAAGPEIAATAAVLDEVVGGLRRTYYAEANAGRYAGLAHAIVSLVSFVEAYLCVVCFRALGARARSVIGAARYRSLEVVRSADLVVWKGRNFRDYAGLTAVTRALTQASAARIAGRIGADFHCVNASFWPIEGRVQRHVFRRALERCRSVTVRDTASVANARQLVPPDVPVTHHPDLSFGILGDVRPARTSGATRERSVAVTLTAWGSDADRARYLEAMVRAAARLVAAGATSFVVVPQVTRAAEDSSALSAAFAGRVEAMGASVERIQGRLSIAALLEVYGSCRMLVGTRMHSCVFARAAGTPFVAVAYDVGPKWDVLASFWDPQFVVAYDVGAGELAELCARVWDDGRDLVTRSEDAWRACVDGAYGHVAALDA